MEFPEDLLNVILVHTLDDLDESYLREFIQTRSSKQIQSFIGEIKRSNLDIPLLLVQASREGRDISFDLLANALNLLEYDEKVLEDCIHASLENKEGLKVLRVIFDHYYPPQDLSYILDAADYGNVDTVKYLYEKLNFHRPPLFDVENGLHNADSELSIIALAIKTAILGLKTESSIKHYDISQYLLETCIFEEYSLFADRFPDDKHLSVILVKNSYEDEDDIGFDPDLLRQVCKHLSVNREDALSNLYTEWPECSEVVLQESPLIGNEIKVFTEESYNRFKEIVKKLLIEGYDIKLHPSFSRQRFSDFAEFFNRETSIHNKINRK